MQATTGEVSSRHAGRGRHIGCGSRPARAARRRLAPAAVCSAALCLAVTLVVVPSASARTALPASARAGAASGGIIVYSTTESFNTVDIANYTSEGVIDVNIFRFSTLLQYSNFSTTACAAAQFPPTITSTNLVKSFTITDHGHKYNFVLNTAAESQYGNHLDAEDVKWSFEREYAIDSVGKYLEQSIGGISAKDPVTIDSPDEVTINVTTPTTLTTATLQLPWLQIHDYTEIKKHITSSDPWAKSWLSDHVADFGPWALQSFTPNVEAVFVPNPHYNGSFGNVKQLIIKTISDPSTDEELLESGQVSTTSGLTFQQVASVDKSPNVLPIACPSSDRDYLGVNAYDPIMKNELVRQAISLAIDRPALIKSVYLGAASDSTAGVDTVFGPTSGTSNFVYDPAKAKQLLAQAGYPHGFAMTLSISPGQPGPYVQDLATAIQSELAAVGITVSINTIPTSTEFSTEAYGHKLQAFLAEETPAFFNPGYSELIWGSCGGLANETGFCFKNMDALSTALTHVTNLKTAHSLVNRLSQDYDTLMPQIYIANLNTPEPRNKCLSSLPLSPYAVEYQLADSTCSS